MKVRLLNTGGYGTQGIVGQVFPVADYDASTGMVDIKAYELSKHDSAWLEEEADFGFCFTDREYEVVEE